jgi:membrane protease YdiL (CAAX protease family)
MMMQAIIAAIFGASVGVWCWLFIRWRAGDPPIPLARRRPVPWLGRDVLFIFFIAWLLPGLAIIGANKFVGAKAVDESAEKPETDSDKPVEKLDTKHPAEHLLGSGDWQMIAATVFVAVVLAPIVEEFLFRMVLQGWLEAVWSRGRRKNPELRQPPSSWYPLLLPAALFAFIHIRFGRESPTHQDLNLMFLGCIAQIAASVMTLAFAFIVLHLGARATAADLGWQPKKLPTDGKYAIFTLIAITPPLLLVQGALNFAIKKADIAIAPDPIPLFFLALALGYLYRRTHRLAPSVILHMAFNATSVLSFFLVDRP